jgi:hypothetical protein
MIERMNFYSIIFSQKRNGNQETHGRRGSSWKKVPPAHAQQVYAIHKPGGTD